MDKHRSTLLQRPVDELDRLGHVHKDILVLVVVDGDHQMIRTRRGAVGADGDDVRYSECGPVVRVEVG